MKRYPLLLLVMLLGGCAHFTDEPIDPESTLIIFEARSLDDPGLMILMQETAPDRDRTAGWDAADLTLAAFYFQPELAVCRARWEAALAGIDVAGERPNPTLSVVPAFNSSTPSSEDISPWIIGVGLDIPLDYSGKRKAGVAEAEALARAAWLQLLQTGWETRSQVRSELLAVYAARQQAAWQQQRVVLLQEHQKQIENRNRLGAAMQLEVRRARQELAAAGVEAMESQKQEALAMARLAAAIGIPLHALDAVAIDFSEFDALPEPVPSAVLTQALTHRADILGQLAEYEASQARLQLEIARQYPDLSIGPGYEFDQGDHKWGLGISLTLPIFNQNQAAIEAARRQREEAAARFNALQARVIGELNEAIADYTYSLNQYRALQFLERETEQSYGLLQQQVAAGAVARSSLVAEELALSATARQVLDARIEALAALGRLERELQSPADATDARLLLNPSVNDYGDPDENK
jgi:cobalt-zinc-cadmium efflux system outer membrane protein